ncbi:MAG TPA: ABC transporter ATP-binding protein [Tepidisphaeraceae bacterium]|nr:ABC transporter ATP-binding protein [Tepidisphaeraceae bacterium]
MPSGELLTVIDKTSDTPREYPLSNNQLLRWMFGFLAPVKWLVAFAIVWMLLQIGLEVLIVKQPGDAVNVLQGMRGPFAAAIDATSSAAGLQLPIIEATSSAGAWQWATSAAPAAVMLRQVLLQLGLLVGFWCVVRYLREVAYSKLSMTMVYYIREGIYDKLQRVGFGFHDSISTGQLINRALTDLQSVRSFLQTAVLVSLEIVISVAFYIVLIYTRNPWVALLALLPLPVWAWYVLRFSKKVQPKVKATLESEDKNVSIITENIAGVHVVKAFATERQEIEKYARNCDTFKTRVLSRIRMFADFNPIIRSIAQASYMMLFFATAVMVVDGRMVVGDFMILQMAMGAILMRLQQVATINEQYQNAIVSARRLHEVMTAEPTVPEQASPKPLPVGPGEVVFENVTFGYDPAKPVLRDISLKARGGAIVAVVGPTGAGKTTFVGLIARFYDPQQGRILLDGVDVRELSLSDLRKNVGFVFQETYLFSDSIAANIAYGRPGITDGEIEAAARLAQAHEFISEMPKGYATVLSERGASLSGGQRQRLAIARAMVTNPGVLVLDDATAAVDPETEDLIRRGLRLTLHGRTTFVIAHRISTVKQADLVVVIEQGRITQAGTHEQLLRQDGHYRHIAAVQLCSDEVPIGGESPSHIERVRDPKRVQVAADDAEKTGESVDVTVE